MIAGVRLGRRNLDDVVGSAQPDGGAGGFVVVEEDFSGDDLGL